MLDRPDQGKYGTANKSKNLHIDKQKFVLEEEMRLARYKDDLALNNEVVPKYYFQDCQDLTREEDAEYEKSANTLIEIQVGAKEGLHMLRQAFDDQLLQREK